MIEKYKKYLPLGSIVLLKDANKKIMVIGFCVHAKSDKNKMYDYLGCLYPEGILNNQENLMFNHEDIAKIFVIGYSDDEEKEYKALLEKTVKEILGKN